MRELAWTFLRLGLIAFGGPAAHIGLMREELVKKRAWLSDERFLDLLSASNLIPGPNSTELAIHIGYERRGYPGLLVAGACFIAPAATLATALAMLYVHYGARPEADAVLYGLRPVMFAIVLQAVWGLAPTAARNTWLRVLGVLSLALTLLGVNELLVLIGAGLASLAKESRTGKLAVAPLLFVGAQGAALGLPTLFTAFVKVGAVLFGSGYVLLPLLRAELVTKLGWLDERTLLDAIVVGQVTPGPLFTSATFIGYVLLGLPGAAVATLGIFLPAFVLVALSSPFVARLRSSLVASALLDGVNVASLSLMAAVLVQMFRSAVVDVPTALIATLCAVLALALRIDNTWLVGLGALAGLLIRAL